MIRFDFAATALEQRREREARCDLVFDEGQITEEETVRYNRHSIGIKVKDITIHSRLPDTRRGQRLDSIA